MLLPPVPSRRWFLRGTALSVLGAACTGTDGVFTDSTDGTDDTDALPCPDPLAGGTLIETLAFMGEDDQAVGQVEGEELNGRLAYDHSALDDDSLVTPTEAFFIRTLPPRSLPEADGWSIAVEGLADATRLDLDSLMSEVVDQGTVLLECSGNRENRHFGLISTATWAGIPIESVLERLSIQPEATRVEIGGFDQHEVLSSSQPGCSWIFTFDQLREAGAFLATHMNGQPLPVEHGAPVRLLVPGWYGCCSAKWVDTLRFVDESTPATSQMREFASRTHQSGVPDLARDFAPATMQLSAMPIRVERWQVDGTERYRIVGIVWGGDGPVQRLQIRTDESEAWVDVEFCPEPSTAKTWSLWQVVWEPARTGTHLLEMRAPDDESVRLELGWYTRAVSVPG